MRSHRTPDWLLTDEAAELLRTSRKTIYRMVDDGTLPARRMPGGQLRFSRQDVEGVLRPDEPEQSE